MTENRITEDFVQWVREQLQAHHDDVVEEMRLVEPKKSMTITLKLKLKHVSGNVFRPKYDLSIPRMAVKESNEPDQQMQLPGV